MSLTAAKVHTRLPQRAAPAKWMVAAAITVAVLGAGTSLVSHAAPGSGNTRPIADFIDRQGRFCLDVNFNGTYVSQIVDGTYTSSCPTGAPPLLFVPPIANFIGQGDAKSNRSASVDYAGLANHYAEQVRGISFGTTIQGTVTERRLADGRALVLVAMQTNNALTWVVKGTNFDAPPSEVLFGYRVPELLNGSQASVGKILVQVQFINTAPGAPLPDLIQLFFLPEEGQELLFAGFRNSADGSLRAAFGVPDGTPGRATGVQTFLNGNPQCGLAPSALADCFPAERIDLRVTGR